MKIYLLNLPKEFEVQETVTPDYMLYDFVNFPPLGLIAIAADVDKRHKIDVLDASTLDITIKETIQKVIENKPDILGISVVTKRLYAMREVAREVKKALPNVKIIAGGPHISYAPREAMELGVLDYALTGFAEKTFPEFVEAVEAGEKPEDLAKIDELYYYIDGKLRINPSVSRPKVLDDLPFPDRSLIDLDLYYTVADGAKMTSMYTSRGCPYRCVYCNVIEKSFYYRSANKIVDEFEHILNLGIEEIHIFDDTFNLNRQRVMDMCNEILRRGLKVRWNARVRIYPFDREMLTLMKKAGCERLHVGVESLDPTVLKYIRKKITLEQTKEFFAICNEVGINTLAYFIVGFTQESEQYRSTLLQDIKKLKPTYIYMNILFPLVMTDFYYELLKDGKLKEDYWAKYLKDPAQNFSIPLWRDQAEEDKLIDLVDKINRKFYFSPTFIINDLKRGVSFKLLRIKAGAAMKMLYGTVIKKIFKPQKKAKA